MDEACYTLYILTFDCDAWCLICHYLFMCAFNVLLLIFIPVNHWLMVSGRGSGLSPGDRGLSEQYEYLVVPVIWHLVLPRCHPI